MRVTSVGVILGLSLFMAAQNVSGLGLCVSSGWRIPVDSAPTWEIGGGISLPPLAVDMQLTGDWGDARWGAFGAQARRGGFTVNWSHVWSIEDLALRYAQAEVEVVSGGLITEWVWAWADPERTDALDFGAWGRLGWPENYPAGWSLEVDLGATPTELELLGPGRTFSVAYTPRGDQTLLLEEVTLSTWWHRWKAEVVINVPDGLEEIRLSGEVRAGVLSLAAKHVYTRHGSTLTIEPSLRLGVGGLIIHSEVKWDPPMVITGFYVLGFTIDCPVGNARVEMTADLGGHGLVRDPYDLRCTVKVPVGRNTAFTTVSWFGGPDTLWGWARTDFGLTAKANEFLTLSAGLELNHSGLLAWEASFTFCLGGTG